jgi:hypothetical protein
LTGLHHQRKKAASFLAEPVTFFAGFSTGLFDAINHLGSHSLFSVISGCIFARRQRPVFWMAQHALAPSVLDCPFSTTICGAH